jgi:hypothetical protein
LLATQRNAPVLALSWDSGERCGAGEKERVCDLVYGDLLLLDLVAGKVELHKGVFGVCGTFSHTRDWIGR